MATPTDLTTTVSGRRCTRSRARTAASSTVISTAVETTTELTSTTTTTSAIQIQSSAAAASSNPPPASSAAEIIFTTSTTESSSAAGTDTPISVDAVSSVVQSSALANFTPSPPAAAAPNGGLGIIASATQAAAQSSPQPESIVSSPTSSDSIDPAASSLATSIATSIASAIPVESSTLQPLGRTSATKNNPQASITPGGSAGIIAPDQGDGGNGITIPTRAETNIGGIVGGVAGGFVGIAMISALLFLCLRRRKREPFQPWQKRMSEKNESGPSPILEKMKAIPANIGALFAKLRGDKAGPAEHPYARHSARSSVSSVYSVRTNGRSRSISEPPSKFRQQLKGFGDRMPSLKRSRTLLGKRQDSLVNGSKSPFPGIVEDPVFRNSKENPFADPEPLEPPRNLRLLNPDPSSGNTTPRLQQKNPVDGLQDQQRPPIAPRALSSSTRGSRDPFASILDELEKQDGSGTPEWLKESAHKRSHSAQTALRSHPPSSVYTSSIYTTADNPFLDPSDAPKVPPLPAVPPSALPPNPPRRPSNAYTSTLPAFNPTASDNSRASNGSFFFFGEPGPSRPTTNMFSAAPTPRFGRQSDPFDLDRPEVLNFGAVGGRREVRASVTRQNSRTKRASSIPNWVHLDDGPYERASAVPGPLRNASVKR